MAEAQFTLTSEKQCVLFGGTSLLFAKLVIRKGALDDLIFELSWKENDPVDPQHAKIPRVVSVSPSSFVNGTPAGRNTYDFTSGEQLPVYSFKESSGGVLLSAFSLKNNPFDVDVHVVVNHYRAY